ncbi:MAG: MBL fold metallo-hydrolase [Lachnospiraceae bacterium]|nr:MBL fold metallo-hydrolase [Lachnospiraceae bacterium]
MKQKKTPIASIGLVLLLLIAALFTGYGMKTAGLFEKDQWTITQYGPRDINSSFYTIYNPRKGLILVDGGWVEDADYVRSIIASLGNEVDAWILTHPHQDHIGAFNVIYNDLREIELGTVYTVDMATPKECLAVASWDSVDAYNDFWELGVENLQYIYTGDNLELCGLQVEIFSAYGDHVKQYSHDYLNDGSMMFKVTGETESMLFCADVGVGISDYLLNRWGQELQADYLQMGHHGYGGLNDNFYQTVNPRVAFFDAPDWLVKDTTGKYDTPEHVRLMEGMGSEIKSFNSAPNVVVLK